MLQGLALNETVLQLTLAPFLTHRDLSRIRRCNQSLRLLYAKLFLSQVWWNIGAFEILTAADKAEVRRMHIDTYFVSRKQLVPQQITHLNTLHRFNDSIDGLLPLKLMSLTFGKKFNTMLPDLPATLIELKFGENFNQPLRVEALQSLTCLEFGSSFNQDVVLPSGLTRLVFGSHFAQQLPLLPQSLKSLIFESPDGSEPIEWSGGFDQPLILSSLPKSLTDLQFGAAFNQPISVGVLPEGLVKLSFGYRFNQRLDVGILPPSLNELNFSFGSCFDQQLVAGALPTNLRWLRFGCRFGRSLRDEGVLPPQVHVKTNVYHLAVPPEFVIARPGCPCSEAGMRCYERLNSNCPLKKQAQKHFFGIF